MPRPPQCRPVAMLIVLVLALAACGGREEPVTGAQAISTPPAATAASPTNTATSAATPTTAPILVDATTPAPTVGADVPAMAAELETLAALNLGLDDEPGGDGIAGVRALPLDDGASGAGRWLVYTYGQRNLAVEEFHLLVVYEQNERGWREVASLELAPTTPADAVPDLIAQGGVRQVDVEPTHQWIQVEGQLGGERGYFALYRLTDNHFQREAVATNIGATVGQLGDLNGDGVAEVVLDASDYAVFCATCGVRYAQYNILRWDGVRMSTVSLTPLEVTAPAALREANQAAMTLTTAGLWKDAVAAIEKGSALNVDDAIFEWNAVYIQYNAEAKAAAVAEAESGGYPLLADIFYGDYAGAVARLRAYTPAELFSLRSPLIIGTPAEGAAQPLANRILSAVEPVLKVRPNLAAAYFLRGWASFLKNGFADEAVLADVELAAQLAADDLLFAQSVAYFGGDPSALSLAAPHAGGVSQISSAITSTLSDSGALTNPSIITTGALGATATVTSPTPATSGPVPLAPAIGARIYFSALDAEGRPAIFVVTVAPEGEPQKVVDEGVQPVLQPGGVRLAFHSTRNDMLGLGGFDLATGERLRFTFNVEDTAPSWNPEGNQLFFASTRYGDGRWRLYHVWADGNGDATDMSYGQDPAWHPTAELIVYKGCDEAGGHCGLWLMNRDGSARRPLTDSPGDARPRWTPDGNRVVFMSDQRTGNWENYAVDVESGVVIQLSNHPANDGLPVVSPDGRTVAWVSDRTGAWAIWTAPLSGGPAIQLTTIGDLPNWLEQGLDWAR
jgi:Tol biopolymer transport system component